MYTDFYALVTHEYIGRIPGPPAKIYLIAPSKRNTISSLHCCSDGEVRTKNPQHLAQPIITYLTSTVLAGHPTKPDWYSLLNAYRSFISILSRFNDSFPTQWVCFSYKLDD